MSLFLRGKKVARENVFHFHGAMRKTVGLSYKSGKSGGRN